MQENIRITNLTPRSATVDIEGIIGMGENEQFECPGARVATYERLRASLDAIAALGTPRITVNIRSAGGDVNQALLIHDALTASGARITTRCWGYVASAATVIAQAASPGRREISANALYLVHNSVSRAEGNETSLAQTLELLRKTDHRIAAIYALRAGRPASQFADLMNENGGNGRWLSPSEALERGLVDRINGAQPVSNDCTEQVRALGLPGLPSPAADEVSDGFVSRLRRLLLSLGFVTDSQPVAEPMPSDISTEVPEVQAAARQSPSPKPEIPAAKLAARPTLTLPCEDPSTGDAKAASNRTAYEEDARNFK